MTESQHITLRELQRRVKSALEGQFALPLWVSAEISEIKVNYSGHCYLELVEKGGDNGVPTAQARAVVWRSNYPRIAGYFEAETGQRLAAGIRILAKVLVTYHELYGFSLQITDIDPSYTLGDMERQRQQPIAQLQQDGVWDMNREAPMPAIVQRIAVVSSANAAGYQDFCKELEKSPYRFTLTLFDAFMQGAAAEESIVEALCGVGLKHRLNHRPSQLSGGQRQAVSLLMCTMVTPKLLLLDEHTAALDPATAEKVLSITKRIVEENHITTLMITHNIRSALELGNRTIMMDDGRILLDFCGAEREKMTVSDLMERFSKACSKQIDNDRMLLEHQSR